MNRIVWIVLFACATVVANASDDSKPASSNVYGSEYPRIHSDLSVTFHLKASEAHKVQVRLANDYEMVRGEDGTWSVTIPPQVPGFHYYYLVVDGVAVNDPGSETFSPQKSGCYRPAAAVCSEKSEPRAPINRVFISGPPNARLPGRSGISTTPISRPLAL
jgi:hypothetical protein